MPSKYIPVKDRPLEKLTAAQLKKRAGVTTPIAPAGTPPLPKVPAGATPADLAKVTPPPERMTSDRLKFLEQQQARTDASVKAHELWAKQIADEKAALQAAHDAKIADGEKPTLREKAKLAATTALEKLANKNVVVAEKNSEVVGVAVENEKNKVATSREEFLRLRGQRALELLALEAQVKERKAEIKRLDAEAAKGN